MAQTSPETQGNATTNLEGEREIILEYGTQYLNAFSEQLKSSNNVLLVSGRFGSGKTTFLEVFFQRQENRRKYHVIHISPANYMISNNEEIFSFLRKDLIVGLITAIDKLENGKGIKDIIKRLTEDYKKLGKKILALPFIAAIAKFGGKATLDKINEINDLIFNTEEQATAENALKYLDSVSSNWIFPSLEDEIIRSAVNILQQENSDPLQEEKDSDNNNCEKEVILIIDDIDRLLPDDAFRLINIVTALNDSFHFNSAVVQTNGEGWKDRFGFNKTILVGDLDNLKHSFQHLYGENSDFHGYIGKIDKGNRFFFKKELLLFELISRYEYTIYKKVLGEESTGVRNEKRIRVKNYYIYVIILLVLFDKEEVNLLTTKEALAKISASDKYLLNFNGSSEKEKSRRQIVYINSCAFCKQNLEYLIGMKKQEIQHVLDAFHKDVLNIDISNLNKNGGNVDPADKFLEDLQHYPFLYEFAHSKTRPDEENLLWIVFSETIKIRLKALLDNSEVSLSYLGWYDPAGQFIELLKTHVSSLRSSLQSNAKKYVLPLRESHIEDDAIGRAVQFWNQIAGTNSSAKTEALHCILETIVKSGYDTAVESANLYNSST